MAPPGTQRVEGRRWISASVSAQFVFVAVLQRRSSLAGYELGQWNLAKPCYASKVSDVELVWQANSSSVQGFE